nr:PQQ-binding-like beta-propeller repeat protein [FCB group bacterium]
AGSAGVSDAQCYVGHYDGVFQSINLKTGEILWSAGDPENAMPILTAPAIDETHIVYGSRDNSITCVNRNTGKSIWVFQTNGQVESSPVLVDGKVIGACMKGFIYLIDLADGSLLWKYEIGSAISSSPAVVNNRFVIGSKDGFIYTFGVKEQD